MSELRFGSGEERIPAARCRWIRNRALPQEAAAGPGAQISCHTAGLHGRHGSLRQQPLLGARDRETGARGTTNCARLCEALREAAEE